VDHGHVRLSLSQRACSDQRHRDFDRVVIGTRKELDCPQHRVMQVRAQIGDFRDPRCTPPTGPVSELTGLALSRLDAIACTW